MFFSYSIITYLYVSFNGSITSVGEERERERERWLFFLLLSIFNMRFLLERVPFFGA